jgi:two-component system, OmpR family, sensor histidine kinase KdpD
MVPTVKTISSRLTPARLRSIVGVGVEIVAAIAIATGVIAALQSKTPAVGLGIIYLLAVLAIAIRRGELPALVTSLLSVLTLNYLFVAPRHRLAISHSRDVVELVVLLIAAVVVGRLASIARQRTAEAEDRAQLASAHEREAKLLADTAAEILPRTSLSEQLESIGNRVATAAGAEHVRIALESPADPAQGEEAIPLPSQRAKTWLYVSAEAGYDRDLVARLAGALAGLIDLAVERDQVARRAAETEAANRAEIAKTAILHAVSHDLRSPLTAIATAASALRTEGVTAGERVELIASIDGESRRLAKLVDDLLDLSRIEAGAVAPQADWCDLYDVAISAARRFGTGHPIQIDLPTDLPLVRADPAQLERVFSNLIENAIKFSPPTSAVQITGGTGPALVTVRVIDHGRGIPREHRLRIFEPFFRGRGGTAGGSGLGLAICRGFVEANGGRIVLQSDVERGTSFAVSFPVLAQPPGETAPERPAPATVAEK